MAEEATPTTSAESQDDAASQVDTTAETTVETQGQTYTQDQLNAVLADHKKRIHAQFTDYDEIKAKLAEVTESSATSTADLETLTGERDTLKSEVEKAQLENLRLRVAVDKSLPLDLLDRLKGESHEELEADADVLMKALRPASGSFDGGVRTQPATKDITTEDDPLKVLEWTRSLRPSR